MPYGGIRRRPGPLLGGSAILAKRNSQQRLQYLQQLQTIVQPKGQEQGYGNVAQENERSLQFSSDDTNNSSNEVNIKLSDQNSVDESLNQFKIPVSNISNTYPDLLSHEIPQNVRSPNVHPIEATTCPESPVQAYGNTYYTSGNLMVVLYFENKGRNNIR